MESKTLRFELTEEQIKIIEAGLKELPGKFCLPVLETLVRQIAKQTENKESEKEEIKTDNGSNSGTDR